MADNPFAAPRCGPGSLPATITADARMQRLVALQTWAPFCIPAYVVTFPAYFILRSFSLQFLLYPSPITFLFTAYIVLYLAVAAATTCCVVLFGAALFRPMTGALLGVLSVLPPVGVLLLLLLLVRTTEFLRSQGLQVGMFGDPPLSLRESVEDLSGEFDANGPPALL